MRSYPNRTRRLTPQQRGCEPRALYCRIDTQSLFDLDAGVYAGSSTGALPGTPVDSRLGISAALASGWSCKHPSIFNVALLERKCDRDITVSPVRKLYGELPRSAFIRAYIRTPVNRSPGRDLLARSSRPGCDIPRRSRAAGWRCFSQTLRAL